jgi:hypothetical protein
VDVTGRRGKAIRQAVRDQLGLEVTEIKPVGLESSAGSTPLRLRVGGGAGEFVFAKLYTKGHVRADRWYKLGRTILYGSLADESPFQTVRRLAEYEDYARSGELLLIDVCFAQVRPSPWRQAVDLGNMMLVLAVRSDPQLVYRRALAYFTETELAGAFAAARGVASPTQLRAFMKRDPRDLLGEFRALAPQRPPIILQRWSARRVALAAAALAVAAAAGYVTVTAFIPGSRSLGVSPPSCAANPSMVLTAQAVPTAAMLPCITALPSGWHAGGADTASGHARFWLDSDKAGAHALTITLSAACDTSGAQQIPSDQPGARRFERSLSLRPQFTDLRFYTFPGGCVTYRFTFTPGASPVLAIPAGSAVAFMPRATLVDYIKNTEDLALCGRGALCTA